MKNKSNHTNIYIHLMEDGTKNEEKVREAMTDKESKKENKKERKSQ